MILTRFHPSKRGIFIAFQVVAFLLIIRTLYWSHTSGTVRIPRLGPKLTPYTGPFAINLTVEDVPHVPIMGPGNLTSYVNAILDSNATHIDKLECPTPSPLRYEHLKIQAQSMSLFAKPKIHYLFALDLRDEGIALLPRLLGSIVEAIRHLGPQYCALSIVAGGGIPDGSYDVFVALRPEMERLGAAYYLKHPAINTTEKGDRIEKLVILRNLALAPMTDPRSRDRARFTQDTNIVFLNDVAACAEDILELAHQKKQQGADMVCAVDWVHLPQITFYDVWVSRTMSGDTYFNVPKNSTWDFSQDLFWREEDAVARRRFAAHRPFQVFACWNGAVVMTAAPFFRRGTRPGVGWDSQVADPRYKVDPVRLRLAMSLADPPVDECYMGEPTLMCKDFWYRGFGKIAVVPSVNLEYSNEDGRKTKEVKGYTSKWVGDAGPELGEGGDEPERIEWQLEPPAQVKCVRGWPDQHWRAWNDSLAEPVEA